MSFVCLYMLFTFQNPSHDWQWPIDTQHGITSSFGEYRGLRFHMGLDFSSGGVEGEPLRPANEGVVFQVRATEGGYGRVAYVRHPSGHVTVYAHLAAFGPSITEALKNLSINPEAYFGTVSLNVAVSKEQLLAYSGESGAGLPHLHFEVRDRQNRAMDPLSLDFPKLESLGRKTVLEGIEIVPIDDSARVNGQNWTFPGQVGSQAIHAKGTVGFRISGYIAGARNSRLGLRGIQLSQDGQLLGSWIPRTIDYDLYRTAGTIFDQAGSGFGPTQFSHAFDNRHAYLNNPEDLVLTHLPTIEKRTQIGIDLMDQRGTWHSFALTLDPQAPVIPMPPTQLEITQPTSLSLLGVDRRLFFIAQDAPGTLHPPQLPAIQLVKSQSHTLSLPLGPDAETWKWETAHGNLLRQVGALPSSKHFRYQLGPWSIEGRDFPAFQTQAVWLEPAKATPGEGPLIFEGPILRFGKEGWPSQGLSLGTSTSAFPAANQLGIYAFSANSGRWSWQSGIKNGILKFTPERFQPLVLARDTQPPGIGKPKFHNYFAGKRIVIHLTDQGSGIDVDHITITASGKPQPYEFDADRRWIVLPGNASGPWHVRVSDRAGNTTTQSNLNL